MRVYSDILTAADFDAAAERPVSVWACEGPFPARKRARRFNVTLTGTSPRGRNTGRYGGERMEYAPPATWDEHGAWMARVFDVDPDAVIAHYDGRDDFHRQTRNAYAVTRDA
ncbi:MAG TPA: hypothetical protein VFP65_23795 [Anaeromyxobacteraceae bacterium]|nr:hypothetical protein [Anaeromyxobacteraceae bacterium]